VSTCDLSDKHGDAAEVLDPLFRAYGGNVAFHGQIQTVKCFEDNSLVKKQLEAPGHGRVLVVDGGGSTRRSLLGDENAALGIKNGCVVFGKGSLSRGGRGHFWRVFFSFHFSPSSCPSFFM